MLIVWTVHYIPLEQSWFKFSLPVSTLFLVHIFKAFLLKGDVRTIFSVVDTIWQCSSELEPMKLSHWFSFLWQNDMQLNISLKKIQSFGFTHYTLTRKNMNLPYSIRMYWTNFWQPTDHVQHNIFEKSL